MRALIAVCLSVAALLSACGKAPAAREAQMVVEVVDDQGRALSGISVVLDGTAVATTDGAGTARATVQAAHSGRVRLEARCPEAYRQAPARRVALLPRAAPVAPLTLRVTCVPRLRTLAVVVRAVGGAGLTVRADGVPVATVQPDGTAHAVLLRAPDTSLRLSLDTSQAAGLVPQFPAREVHVSDRDEIVVFDQALALAQVARRTRARAVKQVAVEARHVPYAIVRGD